MNERDRNLRIAQIGDFVAWLDRQVVAVEKNADDAIAALRARGTKRGQV